MNSLIMVNNDIFETMRNQIAEIKQIVESKPITNLDTLNVESKRTINRLKRFYYAKVLSAASSIIVIVAFSVIFDLSLAFICATCVYYMIAVFLTAYCRRLIDSEQCISQDMLTYRQRVVRVKKIESRWLFFSIPFLCVWIPWFFIEVIAGKDPEFVNGLCIGAVIGLIFGLIFGIRTYRQTMKQIKSIIHDIDEISSQQ